ncbi:hypothetical protein [Bacillus sp. EB01]|uniref:hypothetical protein n=1 Tax=Bacillus sp. EB01 TaxID=1347086 RepID=UPI0005C68C41|nr:hypothetical protein [Bacillus sp. EB01]
MSRNLLLVILAFCLVGVGAKIALAHEKIATFNEAEALYAAGKMRAAEEKFRAAKLNVSVSDHNDAINARLAELSPIRELMEHLDEQAADYVEDGDLAGLVKMEAQFQNYRTKWLKGTAAEVDMLGEMVAFTKIEKDFKAYFAEHIRNLSSRLKGSLLADEELTVFDSFSMIPPSYYGGKAKKVSTIEKNFTAYFSEQLEKVLTADTFYPAVQEGERQFDQLKRFNMESGWLFDKLDGFLLAMLEEPFEKEDYKTFVQRAKDASDLETALKNGEAFAYRTSKLSGLEKMAGQLASNHSYEKAIEIYKALEPMADYSEQIASLEVEWDLHEPVRVLQREYPDEKFVQVLDGRDRFGADSYVAAISEVGMLYFGKVTRTVTQGTVEGDWDGNGIANSEEDWDGNGVLDGNEDSDSDGIPNSDEDINGNGIQDDQEDSDSDGVPNSEDDSGGTDTATTSRRVSIDVVTNSDSVPLPAKKFQFSASYGTGPDPVIYFEADSAERANRYVAYDIQNESLVKILDIEADSLKIESDGVLLADNPTGEGDGEMVYFSLSMDGYYEFDEILVDYVDIEATELENYKGEKVRFSDTVDMVKDGYGWIRISEEYNDELGYWIADYILVEWDDLMEYASYTFIGTYKKKATVTDENLEERSFPVFVVEEIE